MTKTTVSKTLKAALIGIEILKEKLLPYTLSPESTRIELRKPDPAGNVYLQMAVLISMGLAGMRGKIDCGSADKAIPTPRIMG